MFVPGNLNEGLMDCSENKQTIHHNRHLDTDKIFILNK